MDYKSYDELSLVLTVPELASILKIGRNKAYALVRSGQIDSLKLGKQIRIPRNALCRYLENGF